MFDDPDKGTVSILTHALCCHFGYVDLILGRADPLFFGFGATALGKFHTSSRSSSNL